HTRFSRDWSSDVCSSDLYTRDSGLLIRFDGREFGGSAGSMTERQMASKTNPITFFQQVRAETAKVTWPTRRETVISTIMVVIMRSEERRVGNESRRRCKP